MAEVVLGVSGSVSAYRAADLARDLMRDGHNVTACLTHSATRFVSADLFEALTGNPCLVDTFDEPERGRIAHIDIARRADLFVVAPATANLINAVANGTAQGMLTSALLAYEGPLVIAPAMNPAMLANESTQASLAKLSRRAAAIVEPQEGDVACGETGQGKLATNEEILEACRSVLNAGKLLEGKRVLITSGPTEEPIDAARVITNRSSGKMGAALAQAALLMGADVTVISGPAVTALPRNASVVDVRTAEQMREASLSHAGDADLIIGAAAVADFRPADTNSGKIRSADDVRELSLVPNPDIIQALASQAKPEAIVCAFAAEPDSGLEYAESKRKKKGVAAIAVNNISRSDIGFSSDNNELHLVREGREPISSGVQSKLNCALWLLEHLVSDDA
jgi:phosphopantothenoylcysteine decarboxylase/phosphopantothenate--cysteine ligase